ncbi:MAG: Mrp/NBP35 family ATP-binding protein [SAR324 cluster bacterium]|nr:Mrp/NBP35 family ATP-binding protein [SAR324 cluster bacterium]
MSEGLEQKIIAALTTLIEPKLKWNIVSLNLVRKCYIQENELFLEIHLVSDDTDAIMQFREDCLKAMKPLGFQKVHLDVRHIYVTVEGISAVKQTILVGSGKGGVGKSTVAVNLAAALSHQGFKVGLIDADIYGPSLPAMLGITSKPEVLPEEYLLPVEAHNLKVMSIGMLVPPAKAMAWRGSMASGTLIQFIQKTLWGNLDYLIIDLPPGTGDIQLTIAHKIKTRGIVMVSTPQEVVLGDVRRAIDLYQEHKTPILAIMENMSGMICEHCGMENHPFIASKENLRTEVPCYLKIPLHKIVSQTSDEGIPLVLHDASHPISEIFFQLARHIVEVAPVSREILAS